MKKAEIFERVPEFAGALANIVGVDPDSPYGEKISVLYTPPQQEPGASLVAGANPRQTVRAPETTEQQTRLGIEMPLAMPPKNISHYIRRLADRREQGHRVLEGLLFRTLVTEVGSWLSYHYDISRGSVEALTVISKRLDEVRQVGQEETVAREVKALARFVVRDTVEYFGRDKIQEHEQDLRVVMPLLSWVDRYHIGQ